MHNFSPGPGILPAPVIAQIRADLPEFGATGTSILEISHRTPPFEAVIDEAERNLRSLLEIPTSHRVLFLQGGASLQFAMVPYNFLRRSADYVVAGTWGKKAWEDARRSPPVDGAVGARVAWSGADEGWSRMPSDSDLSLDPDADYLHFTSNETIEGVQTAHVPATGAVPLVCDASSDFLSRPVDLARYGLYYAGAQKNAGAAGVTVAIVSDAMLERARKNGLAMLSYPTQVAGKSMHNTPPCFAVYVVMLVTRWLRDAVGGLAAMADRNSLKAARLYAAIDGSGGFYRGCARPHHRSLMNATFRLPTPELEAAFFNESETLGFVGLRGHRAFGGVRASLYNALPLSSVDALIEFMAEFARTRG